MNKPTRTYQMRAEAPVTKTSASAYGDVGRDKDLYFPLQLIASSVVARATNPVGKSEAIA
jgi:hypothetical protein